MASTAKWSDGCVVAVTPTHSPRHHPGAPSHAAAARWTFGGGGGGGGRGPTQRRHPAACAFESHEGPRPARQLVPRRIAGARLGRGHGPCRAPRSRCWRVPQPVDGGDARRAAGDMPGPTRRAGAIEGRRERVLPRVPATRAPPASAGCNPRRGSGGRAGRNTAGSEAARGRAEGRGRGRGLFVRGEGRGVSD